MFADGFNVAVSPSVESDTADNNGVVRPTTNSCIVDEPTPWTRSLKVARKFALLSAVVVGALDTTVGRVASTLKFVQRLLADSFPAESNELTRHCQAPSRMTLVGAQASDTVLTVSVIVDDPVLLRSKR